MKVGAKRKKQDEQADIRLFSDGKHLKSSAMVKNTAEIFE